MIEDRSVNSHKGADRRHAYLNRVDHLLCLVLAALVRYALDLFLEETVLFLVRPVRALYKRLLRADRARLYGDR